MQQEINITCWSSDLEEEVPALLLDPLINKDSPHNLMKYIASLAPPELYIKTNRGTFMREKALSLYIHSFRRFTPAVAETIQQMYNDILTRSDVQSLIRKCRLNQESTIMPHIMVIGTVNNIEYGLPFTLANCIFLPIERPPTPATLLHELIHVLQRYYEGVFNSFYRDVWPWIEWKGEIPVESFQLVHNPDGMNMKWAWLDVDGSFYWSGLRIKDYLLRDTRINEVYYQWIQHSHPSSGAGPSERGYWAEVDHIPSIKTHHMYHPNEMFAYIFADNGIPRRHPLADSLHNWLSS